MAANKNKSSKKVQLNKDQTKILAIISIASVLVIGSLVISKGFISQGNYLRKVNGLKGDAVEQLEKNKAAVEELTKSYESFTSQNPNLLGGNPDSESDRGGTNADLVLDALPSKYDFPALASSVEKLLSAYTIRNIAGVDDSLAQQEAAGGAGPVEIPFSFEVESSYDGFKEYIDSFNRSIRPIQIVSIEMRGTNDSLVSTIQAKSFYQPETGIQITEEQVN